MKPLNQFEMDKLKVGDIIRHTVWNDYDNKSQGIYFDAIGVIVEDNFEGAENKKKVNIIKLLKGHWDLDYFAFYAKVEDSDSFYIGDSEEYPEYFI